jgi:putative lipoic acid-binding regulatory protein
MDREAALELFRSQHDFPGIFDFRVVVRPESVNPVLETITASAGEGGAVQEVRQRLSRKGNYISLHVSTHVPNAEAVLDVYEALKDVSGVMTTL